MKKLLEEVFEEFFFQTKTAFEWTDTVKAVDLPESMAETEAGVVGQLAGWGEDGVSEN